MLCDFKGKVDNHNGDIWEEAEEHIREIYLRAQRQTQAQSSCFMTKL